jgi:biotin operon repressor
VSRFAIFPAAVYDDRRLTPHLRDLLGLLSTYADKSGWCWPAQETLANQLGVTRQAVNQRLAQLVEIGYVETKRRRGSSLMRLVYDLPDASPADIRCKPGLFLDESPAFTELSQENDPTEGDTATRLPPLWQPPSTTVHWFKETFPQLNLLATLDAFRTYWHKATTQDAIKPDWNKAFRKWTLKAAGDGQHNRGAARPGLNGYGPRGRSRETGEEARQRLARFASH